MASTSRPNCADVVEQVPSGSTAATATPKEYEIERLYREAPMLLIGEEPPRSRR